MVVCDAHVFPGFLTPVLTQLFFPKPPTTFLTCFCRGERRKYAGKKVRLNRGSNSQPPGHESNTLTSKSSGQGLKVFTDNKVNVDQMMMQVGKSLNCAVTLPKMTTFWPVQMESICIFMPPYRKICCPSARLSVCPSVCTNLT